MEHYLELSHSKYLRWMRPLVEEPKIEVADHAEGRSKIPWTALFLLTLNILGLAASTAAYIQWRSATSLSSIVVWALAIIAIALLRPRTFSLILCIFYITITTCHAATLTLSEARHGVELACNVVAITLSSISLVTVINMQMRHPFLSRDGISPPFAQPSPELCSPEDNLTMWQWMTVSWLAPLIANGTKRQLHDNDVWQLPYQFQHTRLHEAFRNLTGSVVVRLLKANWFDISVLILLSILSTAASYSIPMITQQLLQAMRSVDKYKSPAVTWAILILVSEFVNAQTTAFCTWYGRRAYERSRGAMITMLHEKVLQRKILGGQPNDESEKPSDGHAIESGPASESNEVREDQQDLTTEHDPKPRNRLRSMISNMRANIFSKVPFRRKASSTPVKQPASMGKILNLMRNDVYEVSQRFWEFQTLIISPLGLIVSLILVWRVIGWPSLIGIAVIIFGQIITGFLAKGLLSAQVVRRKATDHKLQQITQYIEAIRHLRWYGWHGRKIEALLAARQRELDLIVKTFFWGKSIVFVNIFGGSILPVVTFWAYTKLAGRELTVDVAFPALQLFDLLQANLQIIPQLITDLLNAAVAVGRIEDFMSEPDVVNESAMEVGDVLQLKDASFAWPGIQTDVLHHLDVSFSQGLSIVAGQVASGKTALLQAMLGELDLRGGQMLRPDTAIGYCAQTPWLESMTIRENILFCSPYDENRYKHVVEACALLPDLASFAQGDLSPIGENGIGLSGGQKARVALARALYSRASILLLDDPLSALDQQTAEWIVARCFNGSLINDRTVVLVTHRIDLCRGMSEQIVELKNGRCRVYYDTSALADGDLSLSRIESIPPDAKQAQEEAAIKTKFEDEEHRAHGGLKFRVYWEYIKAGKIKWWTLVIIAGLLWRLLEYGQTWFLKTWGEAYNSADLRSLLSLQSLTIHPTQSPISHFFDSLPHPAKDPGPWLFWYMIIVIAQAVPFIGAQLMMIVVTYTASKNMFRDIMFKISHATFRFYDVTPVGRLMNRLTSDIGTIDGPMSSILFNFAWESIAWTISLIVLAAITPLFTVVSIAMAAVFVYIFRQFLPTSQSLRRLEMVSLSPLMSNFGALLTGLVTVRAFHAQPQFQDRVVRVTDAFQKMDHFYWSLQTWLTYRFQLHSAVSTLLLTLLAIFSGFTPGLTAFVLVAAQRFVLSTFRVCKQYGNLQLDFVSVERVVELLDLEQEDPGSDPPPAYWPLSSSKNPAVEFEDVTVRYAPHLDPALNSISFSIPSGSSTAIIGRTGSGKSTLALSMLATIKPDSGRILVDGIDISKVSKQDLRSRVTFLAQDPILFQGTIKSNLDPMEDYSVDECVSVLKRIHGDTRYNWSLDTLVDAGGKNLSQGQRQLVGLARAILRRSAVIIMDEATASVDLETSWEIQRVLKEELAGSTVITIAHRASAVRDCDFVVKLDKGKLAAFGTPEEVEIGGEVAVKDDSQATEEMTISNETTVRADSSSSEGQVHNVQTSETVETQFAQEHNHDQDHVRQQATMQDQTNTQEQETQEQETQEQETQEHETRVVSTSASESAAASQSDSHNTQNIPDDTVQPTDPKKVESSATTSSGHDTADKTHHESSSNITSHSTTNLSTARSYSHFENQTHTEQSTTGHETVNISGTFEPPNEQDDNTTPGRRDGSSRTSEIDMVIF